MHIVSTRSFFNHFLLSTNNKNTTLKASSWWTWDVVGSTRWPTVGSVGNNSDDFDGRSQGTLCPSVIYTYILLLTLPLWDLRSILLGCDFLLLRNCFSLSLATSSAPLVTVSPMSHDLMATPAADDDDWGREFHHPWVHLLRFGNYNISSQAPRCVTWRLTILLNRAELILIPQWGQGVCSPYCTKNGALYDISPGGMWPHLRDRWEYLSRFELIRSHATDRWIDRSYWGVTRSRLLNNSPASQSPNLRAIPIHRFFLQIQIIHIWRVDVRGPPRIGTCIDYSWSSPSHAVSRVMRATQPTLMCLHPISSGAEIC